MKMMNVEMEFVAFDAQDVIMTSGKPATAKFTMSGELSTDNQAKFFSTTWYYNGGYSDYQHLYSGSSGYFTVGTTYLLTEGVSYGNGTVGTTGQNNYYIYNAYAVDSDTVADKTLTSLADIAQWLEENSAQ